jgi:N-carbamoylputrescine amidase
MLKIYINFQLARSIPWKNNRCIIAVAKKIKCRSIASLFWASGGLYHNTTAVLDADGTYLGKYRKMHIQMINFFTKNSLRQAIWVTKFLIPNLPKNSNCWDQWYPEASRITALMELQKYFIQQQLVGNRSKMKKL